VRARLQSAPRPHATSYDRRAIACMRARDDLFRHERQGLAQLGAIDAGSRIDADEDTPLTGQRRTCEAERSHSTNAQKEGTATLEHAVRSFDSSSTGVVDATDLR